jgi:hypothetical protein
VQHLAQRCRQILGVARGLPARLRHQRAVQVVGVRGAAARE